MTVPWVRPRRPVPGWLLVLVAGLVAIPFVPGAAARAPGLSDVTPAQSSVAYGAGYPSFYSGSFADRSGYSSWQNDAVLNSVPATGPELVVVTFRASDPSFFETPPPGAPPLSLAQIADRWGLPVGEMSAVEQYFESSGLTVLHVSADRLSLTLSGPATAVDRAFGTRLESGSYDGHAVTFPSLAPSVPAGIANVIADVAGLSSGFDSFTLPLASVGPAVSQTDLVTPAIARAIYNLSGLYNLTSGAAEYPTGDAIALLLWGDGYAPSDISTFYSSSYPSSFPTVHWSAYPVDGAPAPSANAPNDPSGAPRELTLDMEWAGSMAPGVTLDAVYAPDGPSSNGYSPTDATMIDALNTAVGLPSVRAISMSFGTTESTDSGLTGGFETAFATATQHGISLLAATGDQGGDATACNGVVAPEFPSTSDQVLAVGGTAVTLDRNVIGQVSGHSESAWSDSGGGFSAQVSMPTWQSGVPEIAANGHRGLPDVAASSALNYVYFDGQDGQGAGTSFATPLWAGLLVEMDARAGTPFGFVNPRLYVAAEEQPTGRNGLGLTDITTGANCVAQATKGWDAVTGWGSPSAVLLYEDLTGTFVNLTISATPATVAPGGSVTVQVVLTNRTSRAPVPGISAEIDLDADSAVGPCVGRFSTATVTSNAKGVVSASLAVPACYLGSRAVATVTVASDGLYGQNSTTIAVNLLGLVPALGFLAETPYNVVGFVIIMAVAIALGGVLGRRPPRSRGPNVASPVLPPSGATAPASPASPSPSPAAGLPTSPSPDPATAVPPPGTDSEPFDMGHGR